MDPNLINELLHEGESNSLDFKRGQYPFDDADDRTKSELLKDILAFANSWRRTDAFIMIGVHDVPGGRSQPVGVAYHHDDAKLQQFVNSKTNRPIAFAYEAITIDGVQVGVVRIDVQERPFFLKKDYGLLNANTVYIRRGSSTDKADPEEVHRMGASSVRSANAPDFEEKLRLNIIGRKRADTAPPYGTGEPMRLELELTITNVGRSPVFIVTAELRDASGTRSISFGPVCSDADPLQPGGRRKATHKLLYHDVHSQRPRTQKQREQLDFTSKFQYELLRFICQDDSTFHVETGRGTILTYPASDVCDQRFLEWPSSAPKDILAELGSKSLADFEKEEREALEATEPVVRTGDDKPIPETFSAEVLSLEFQDLDDYLKDSLLVLGWPRRRFIAEVDLTNFSDAPLYLKEGTLRIGSRFYPRDASEAVRIEPHEFKRVQLVFSAGDTPERDTVVSSDFEIELTPAIGDPVRVSGMFPLTSSSS